MAIVIHIIKNKRYAYDHFRVGNRIHTKYLYPCDKKGNRITPEHSGGAPAEGKTPAKGEPKQRGGWRPRKNPPKPAVRAKEPGIVNLGEMQELNLMVGYACSLAFAG